jgi:hypothetical protein
MAKKPILLKIKLNPSESNELNLSANAEPRQLCQILSIERDHDTIGSCLFNIHSSLLPTWISFCQQSAGDTYQQGTCELKWQQMAKSQYNLTHLRQWAQLDSPINYLHFQFEQIYHTLNLNSRNLTSIVII